MLTRAELRSAQERAAEWLRRSGISFSPDEQSRIEVADFGLGRLEQEGAQILTLVQTGRIGVKVIVLFPRQTLPEHWHPRVGDDPGKEETVRVQHGTLFVYRAGVDTIASGFLPPGKEGAYTVRHEIVMSPGDQCTFAPGEKHWFQGGPDGAVLFSFSSVARDILDRFTDPLVKRQTEVQD